MTSGAARLGTLIGQAGQPGDGVAPVELLTGTVVSISATAVRVDSFGRSLSCIPLAATQVGQTVWVLRSGDRNLILGSAVTQQFRGASVSATFASGVAPVVFSPAFPTTCDFAGWDFDGSVGAGSLTVSGISNRTASGMNVLCSSATFNGALQISYWAWGH